VPFDDTGRRLDKASQDMEKRRLAGAGAAEQRDAVTRLDLEIDVRGVPQELVI